VRLRPSVGCFAWSPWPAPRASQAALASNWVACTPAALLPAAAFSLHQLRVVCHAVGAVESAGGPLTPCARLPWTPTCRRKPTMQRVQRAAAWTAVLLLCSAGLALAQEPVNVRAAGLGGQLTAA
jgi:hypothetical protein